MYILKKFCGILALSIFIGCGSKNEDTTPGICLSFDDKYIEEWFNLRALFKEYNVKATFFITNVKSLTASEVVKLKILESEGHEIGFHGTNHVFAEYYIKQFSYSRYLKDEIDPGLFILDSLGFKIDSFAYPYGSKYWFTDFLLLRKFKMIRGVSTSVKVKDLAEVDEIFFSFDGDRTLNAFGIDAVTKINKGMLEGGISRIKKRNEVLLLYGHQPANEDNAEGYKFKKSFLITLFEMAKTNDIKFYTMRELAKE